MNDLKISPGDTVTWSSIKTKVRCWGLVEWIDEKGVHVIVSSIKSARITLPPARISGCTPGRDEFDRHM